MYDYQQTIQKTTPTLDAGNRVFVYGIFLGQARRDQYGMYDAQYTTIPEFYTVGNGIVQAERASADIMEKIPRLALTGVKVTLDPSKWERLDALEGGYDRIMVRDDRGELLWMYVKAGTKGVEA